MPNTAPTDNQDLEHDESAVQLLAYCPLCHYALTGLPRRHRCPECGLRIDRQWNVFGGRHRPSASQNRRTFVGYVRMAGAIVGAGCLAVFVIQRAVAHSLVALTVVVALWPRRPGRDWVALGDDGMTVCLAGAVATYPWLTVGHAWAALPGPRYVVQVDDRTLTLGPRFSITTAEGERFVRAVNNHSR